MKKGITIGIVGLSIVLLNAIPLFLYANSWVLYLDSLDFQTSGYAWYYRLDAPFPMNFLMWSHEGWKDYFSILGLFFWIGTVPLYFLFSSSWKQKSLWIFGCFLSFNIALDIASLCLFLILIIWDLLWRDVVEKLSTIFSSIDIIPSICAPLGIVVSILFLFWLFRKLSRIQFTRLDLSLLILFWCLVYGFGLYVCDWYTNLWTRWAIPALRMYVIFLWHICMSFLLFILVLRRLHTSSSESHVKVK